MSLSALIDRLIPRAEGWSTVTGNRSLLKLIEQGRDELVQSVQSRRKWRGTDNKGFPPYLKTTAGTYKYDIIAANLSCDSLVVNFGGTDYTVTADEVMAVIVDANVTGHEYNTRNFGDAYVLHDINSFTNETDRIYFLPVPVEITPSYENTPPTVMFLEDPGNTTEKYFVDFTWRFPPLTSKSIPLGVPPEFEKALEDFVVGTIQEHENGGPSDLLTRFYNFWMPKYRRKMNAGVKTISMKAQPRIC